MRDMCVTQLEYPNHWCDGIAAYGKTFVVLTKYCTQSIPDDLNRCKK